MRILIVEDNKAHSNRLLQLLQDSALDISTVDVIDNVSDSAKKLNSNNYDLVFLDVSIHGGSAFDVLDQVSSPDFDTVFITGHNDQAIRAIRYGALDFLEKPILEDEFNECIERILKRIKDKVSIKENLLQLKENLASKKNYPEKMVVPVLKGFRFIKKSNLIRINSDGGYCFLHLKDEAPQLVSKTIKHFEEMLDPAMFVRVHRSHIINLSFIKQINTSESNSITLINGDDIPIARRNKNKLDQLIEQVLKSGLEN